MKDKVALNINQSFRSANSEIFGRKRKTNKNLQTKIFFLPIEKEKSQRKMSFRPAGMSDEEDNAGSIVSLNQSLEDNATEVIGDQVSKPDWQSVVHRHEDNCPDFDIMDYLKECIVEGRVEKLRDISSSELSFDQPIVAGWNSCGVRPIFLAMQAGQHEVVKYLLEMKVSLVPDENGLTPLMSACGADLDGDGLAKSVEQYLAQTGVDPNEHQGQRISSLMLACKNGLEKVVKILVKHPKIQVDSQDSQGWTALMYAVDNGFGNIARFLLDSGANPDISGLDGTFPIDIALSRRCDNLVAIIQDYSDRKGIVLNQDSHKKHKYSDIDTILAAVPGAQEYTAQFDDHKIGKDRVQVMCN